MVAGNTEFNLHDQSVSSNKGQKTMDDAKLIWSICRAWMAYWPVLLYRVRARTQLANSMAHRKYTTIIMEEAMLFISGESCGSSSTSRRTAMAKCEAGRLWEGVVDPLLLLFFEGLGKSNRSEYYSRSCTVLGPRSMASTPNRTDIIIIVPGACCWLSLFLT